jgi:predicted transcriptional regulator
MAKIAPVSMFELQLCAVGTELALARAVLAAQTELAKAAAVAAAEAGVSEREIARQLGVARSRTVRRWLGK